LRKKYYTPGMKGVLICSVTDLLRGVDGSRLGKN
jgi:hypothetical protein